MFAGTKAFKQPLGRFFADLRGHFTPFVSIVTYQELAAYTTEWKRIKQFIETRDIERLPFCINCAITAGGLQAKVGPPSHVEGLSEEVAKAQWHHDAAIVGSAVWGQMDLLVTADKGMVDRYTEHFDGFVLIPPEP